MDLKTINVFQTDRRDWEVQSRSHNDSKLKFGTFLLSDCNMLPRSVLVKHVLKCNCLNVQVFDTGVTVISMKLVNDIVGKKCVSICDVRAMFCVITMFLELKITGSFRFGQFEIR